MEEMFESSVGHLYNDLGRIFYFFITLFIFVGDLLLHRVSKDASLTFGFEDRQYKKGWHLNFWN